jgi:probable F420-dependent oxidoreductase
MESSRGADGSGNARWGLSLDLLGVPLHRAAPVIRAAEEAGFTDGWPGEVAGADAFTPCALAATCTDRMRLGTGVANAYARGPAILATHAAALQDLSGGRFSLGVGSSSNVIVERWNGMRFEKPLTKVRETVEFLRPVLRGERAPSGGFKLERAPQPPVPIVVGALRERMLRLAGEVADGAFLNFLPLGSVETVLREVRAGEREAGREAGSVETFCRFFCIQGDLDQARQVARWMFVAYATVPVYESFFRWLGYGEAIDPVVEAWRAGDRGQALELAPPELVEEIFVLGDAAAQRERLQDFQRRGIDCPVLLIVPAGGPRAEIDPDVYTQAVRALARG